MFSLSGKKALVTGATGGIGGAIAGTLHEAGAQLAVSGSKRERVEAFAQSLPGASALVCNLSELSTIDAFAAEAEAALGGLDVLVANAGITRDNLAIRMKDEEWQQVIDVNLTATFRLVRAVLKGMVKRRSGRVIIITSVVASSGNPGQANYCAAKAGLEGMGRALALETASRGVTVNCIAPGFIATPMTDVLTDEQKARILPNIPMGKMGAPEDIAAATLFLASDEARYITGQVLHVNGGMYRG
jgi:3-oxoacyl-[acyl-carrier protein] reductase